MAVFTTMNGSLRCQYYSLTMYTERKTCYVIVLSVYINLFQACQMLVTGGIDWYNPDTHVWLIRIFSGFKELKYESDPYITSSYRRHRVIAGFYAIKPTLWILCNVSDQTVPSTKANPVRHIPSQVV